MIEIDEDSHSRFIGESSVGAGRSRYTGSNSGGAGLDDAEDVEWRLDQFCSPRNSLLSLVSDFVVKCTAKLTEINKKDRQEKSIELLDTKCYTKLADIAHSLLYTYDQECIKAKGLQKYMTKVFPITDWSQESMRPSLTIIIRRLDKLFAKMHKSVKSVRFIFQNAVRMIKITFDFSLQYQAVEWNAAAGLLNAAYLTLWKHPYIVNVPNLKNLIGTCQCLVVGEDSLTSLTDHHGPSGRRPELPPQGFCSIVFKLVALQVWSIF